MLNINQPEKTLSMMKKNIISIEYDWVSFYSLIIGEKRSAQNKNVKPHGWSHDSCRILLAGTKKPVIWS